MLKRVLQTILSRENLSSGEKRAGCADSVGEPSGAVFYNTQVNFQNSKPNHKEVPYKSSSMTSIPFAASKNSLKDARQVPNFTNFAADGHFPANFCTVQLLTNRV
mmetsp:Transcript_4761/g.7413  ORF Transcript_4761/g.7413 Transcript_4761/m.7413 type:complete len:105 (-) Transcript_4761:102-416(-)